MFKVIELSAFIGKYWITLDTNDTSVSVICQIFQEFSILIIVAEWLMH